MNIALIIIACATSAVADQQFWSLPTLFANPTINVKTFFDEQRSKVAKAFISGYDQAMHVSNSVNNYVEEQQKKFSTDINNNIENVKYTTRTPEAKEIIENPELVLTVPAIISRNGYPCEIHTVNSKGYILNLHRIPHGKNGGLVPKKTVLLQHGLFASSADWILNGPEKGLGYVLADAGYDVWMANIRGNVYSKEHVSLKTNSKSYWNFSWHDVALHDVPNIIDYILKVKGSSTKIAYIGHSMGTTILFAMLTLRPEYNDVLTAGYALAPVVFMNHLKSPLKALAPIAGGVAQMEMLYGSYEFVPKHSSLGSLSNSCSEDSFDSMICKSVIFYICGYDEKQFNKTILPIFLKHLGTGTSWKTAIHFSQEILSGNFQAFDYGSDNQQVYGSATPPEYDLSKITLPITLLWAQNDLLSSEEDVRMLYERLPSTTEMYMVPYEDFNHVDYLMAIDAPILVNKKILDSLQKVFNKGSGFTFNLRLV